MVKHFHGQFGAFGFFALDADGMHIAMDADEMPVALDVVNVPIALDADNCSLGWRCLKRALSNSKIKATSAQGR